MADSVKGRSTSLIPVKSQQEVVSGSVVSRKVVAPGSDVSVLGSEGSSSIFHDPVDHGSSVSGAISSEISMKFLQGFEGSASV